MTTDEYRDALQTLGLSQNAAGRFFGVNDVTARRWAMDGPPRSVEITLRLMLRVGMTTDAVEEMLKR